MWVRWGGMLLFTSVSALLIHLLSANIVVVTCESCSLYFYPSPDIVFAFWFQREPIDSLIHVSNHLLLFYGFCIEFSSREYLYTPTSPNMAPTFNLCYRRQTRRNTKVTFISTIQIPESLCQIRRAREKPTSPTNSPPIGTIGTNWGLVRIHNQSRHE